MMSARQRPQPAASLLFFAITAAAVGFVYLYVVPQLELEPDRREAARGWSGGRRRRAPRLAAGDARRALARRELRDAGAQRSRQPTDARVTLLGVRDGAGGPAPEFVIGDSQLERTAILPDYPAAATAVAERPDRVRASSGRRRAQSARSASPLARRRRAALGRRLLARPLDDVDDNVALIRRQILIAGAIALAAALLAGWLVAAGAHARRLRRLEAAAEQVAEGDFTDPIPVDSTDEVGQLARTFNEMQQRLARLDSARKEFIANASHELRTPIFSLGGFVELLEDEDPDPGGAGGVRAHDARAGRRG